MGLSPDDVEVIAEFVDDHGGWSYTTVVARMIRPAELTQNYESARLEWIGTSEVTSVLLHDGFAASWPSVLPLVEPWTEG